MIMKCFSLSFSFFIFFILCIILPWFFIVPSIISFCWLLLRLIFILKDIFIIIWFDFFFSWFWFWNRFPNIWIFSWWRWLIIIIWSSLILVIIITTWIVINWNIIIIISIIVIVIIIVIIIVCFFSIISSSQTTEKQFIWILGFLFWWRYLKLILFWRRCIFSLMVLKWYLIKWQSRLTIIFLKFWTFLCFCFLRWLLLSL